MTEAGPEDASKGASFDNQLKAHEVELFTRMEAYRRALARAALTPEEQESVYLVVHELRQFADEIHDIADGVLLEPDDEQDRDRFGGEESYFTIFRLLCLPKKAGKPVSLDEIMSTLEKNYDMSAETRDTVDETIREWVDDFAEDAYAKFGINGKLVVNEYGFVFVTYGQPQPPEEPVRTTRIQEPRPVDVDEPAKDTTDLVEDVIEHAEDNEADLRAAEFVLGILAEGVRKQSYLRNMLTAHLGNITYEDALLILRKLSDDGIIIKVKPRGGAVYYSKDKAMADTLAAGIDKKSLANERREHAEDLDTHMGARMLETLAQNSRHLNAVDAVTLWKRVHRSNRRPEKSEGKYFRKNARLLEKLGLLKTGEMPKGTRPLQPGEVSKSIRGARSNSHYVFKVKLASNGVKREIKQILGDNRRDLEKWLEEKWQAYNEESATGNEN